MLKRLKAVLNSYTDEELEKMDLWVNSTECAVAILVEVYDKLIDFEPAPSCFRLYQEGLIEYNKEHLQKQKKEKAENDIIELTSKLSNKQIILDEYFKKIEEIKKELTDNE